LPFVELALLQFYAFWGVPSLYEWPSNSAPPSSAMTDALLAASLTSAVVWGAAYFGRRIGRVFAPVVAKALPAEPGRLGGFALGMWLMIGVVAAAGLPSFLSLEYQNMARTLASYYPLLTLLALRGLRHEAKRSDRMVLLAATGVLAFAGLLTGMMEAAIRPLFLVALVYVVTRGTVPARWAAVLFVMVALLQPAKHAYRELAWDADSRVSTDVGVALDRWGQAFAMHWADSSAAPSASSGTLANRLNELRSIARTFEMVPDRVPYDHGEAWDYLLTAPLPRALVENKRNMTEVFNDRFNLTFGLQSWDTIGLSTESFPLVADGYWNFGWLGVVLVAAVIGLMLGAFSAMFPPSTWGALTIGIAIVVETHARTFMGQQIASFAQRVIGVGLACWALHLLSGRARKAVTHPARATRPSPDSLPVR
jgi:hypothetical protein